MYLANELVEKDILRQGDILTDIHILGAINITGILYTSTSTKPDERTTWTVPAPPKFADAIVLSHSCEVALENRVKVTSIILAPLRDINTATSTDKIDELIATNLIDQTGAVASYLKYFYLPPYPRLKHPKGAVADFSKCFSVRKNSYEFLLSRKIAQLSASSARSMALKLGLYFHRNDISSAA